MKKEIYHDGKIIEITPEFTSVEIISSSACSQCHAKGLCGFSEEESKVVMVPTSPYTERKVGDTVTLALKQALGLTQQEAASATSVTLVFLSVLLTALGLYHRLARYAGAGTLVPITGFANAVASPAIDFRAEGIVTGTAVKMFTVAGPVIVFGTAASVVYGLVLYLLA